jgi:hypothetical protein
MKKKSSLRHALPFMALALSLLAGCSDEYMGECISNAQCQNGQFCVYGMCLKAIPLGAECGEQRMPPCVEGICKDGRCTSECENNGQCTNEACVKGVCTPFVCAPACTREEACVDAGDATNLAKGKCVGVKCEDENGDYTCDPDPLKERCVNAKDPQNPTKGECRPTCAIPLPTNNNTCNPGEVCVGIESQTPVTYGTCEAGCFMNRDCDEWETCEGADESKLAPGICKA